jgi:hypothetical protein
MDEREDRGDGGRRTPGSRWVPVAITILAIASVAAEIWGVVRGLSLMMTR